MNLMPPAVPQQPSNPRKRQLREEIEASLDEQERWRKFNATYHEEDLKFMRFLIPPGKRVLELGCGTGDLLAALEPSYGVSILCRRRRCRNIMR
jgi:ubiquinone/menaquinone biosynthesis C-methylase UbiE